MEINCKKHKDIYSLCERFKGVRLKTLQNKNLAHLLLIVRRKKLHLDLKKYSKKIDKNKVKERNKLRYEKIKNDDKLRDFYSIKKTYIALKKKINYLNAVDEKIPEKLINDFTIKKQYLLQLEEKKLSECNISSFNNIIQDFYGIEKNELKLISFKDDKQIEK